MTQSNAPSLSVALITVDTFESVRKTVEHLAAQTVASEIELVLCAPTPNEFALDTTAVSGLHSVQIIETGSLSAVGPIRAQAARTATAAVVAYAEDHCYPDPGWAEALLRAHQEPHAAVGPAMRNANPETLVSWADFIQEYGPWMAPGRRGVVPLLQGHNSSYKRDVLLSYGPRLDALMESETVLFWDLRTRGHTLFFEPDATAAHVNFSRWRVWLRVLWHLGRVFAHTRALEWSRTKRIAFTLASPLIPGVRLARLMASTRQNRVPATLMARTLPMLMLGLTVDAVAQAAGSAFGPGSSIPKLTAMEFRRVQVNAS